MFQIPLEAPSWKQLSSTFLHFCVTQFALAEQEMEYFTNP